MAKDKMLSTKDAAERLNVSIGTIYNWVNAKKIRFYKVGRSVKFSEADLKEFIERRAVDPIG